MVFENLTLVELHTENSRLGTGRRGEGSEGYFEEESESSRSEEGGRSLRGPLMVLVLLAAGAAFAARRRRQTSSEEPATGEQISIEQATEQ